ncbi:hypothetical protein NDU88_007564 [Pleurodeles waltl]|uniref:Uncharacterized protein n=1 Tax=Pleurodeles waltl TaxID=8319 RepID=A0AAV7PTZ4_PLEWA|nr:hypothetical protein NDU88_007564 [Pleurodeles waltl]
MAGPVIARARLQAPTGPPTPVSPCRGGAAPSRGVAAPPHPAVSLWGPGSRHRRARGPLRSTASGAGPALPGPHSSDSPRRPRTPRGRREPPMSPGFQGSRRGTSGRPVPHPGSKFRA